MLTNTEYSYWLYNIEHITSKKIDRLLQVFHNAEEVYKAPKDIIRKYCDWKECDMEAFVKSKDKEKIRESYAKLIKKGIYFVSKEDVRYPVSLREIYDAPYGLYIKGNLPVKEKKTIAIIGARECSMYGKEIARFFAKEIAKTGLQVISGLARGIDTYAHEGALEVKGVTYGILGCGVDICYPKENLDLYMKMQKDGGIISEFAPGARPYSYHFPMRNRLISGLSDGILVIEAKEKSGSLITVDMGLEQGKEIYAVPGRITDRFSDGCNNLIKMGAKLVTKPEDILEDVLPNYIDKLKEVKNNLNMLETDGKKVYVCLNLEPKHIETLAMQTGLAMNLLMEQLVLLELKGLIEQPMKNYYIVKD